MSRYIDVDKIQYRNGIVTRLAIEEMPTAEVQPIVYGEWININGIKTCNQCGAGNASAYDWFCPNCGATMRKESEEEE